MSCAGSRTRSVHRATASNDELWLRLGAALLAIVSITSVWATAPIRHVELHSDLLYLPALGKDLVDNPSSVSGWHLTPAPYLVPDLALYMLLRAVTGSVEGAFTAYAMIAAAGLLAGMCYAASRLRVASPAQAMLAGSVVVLALAWYSRAGLATIVLLPSCHGSLCVVSLFAVGWLGPRLHRPLPARTLIAAALLGGLVVVSDALAAAQILLPLAMTARLAGGRRRDLALLVAGPVLVAAALRAVLWLAGIDVPSSLPSPVGWWCLVSSAAHWAKLPGAFLEMTTSWPLSLVLAVGGVGGAIAGYRQRETRGLSAWLLVTAAASFFAPLLTTMLFDAGGVRYILPCLVVLPLGMALLVRRMGAGGRAALTAVIAVAGAVLAIGEARGAPPGGYPDAVACLDEVARQSGLHRGVGDYWDAKVVDYYSREGLRVNAIRPTLEPYSWISNDRWLLDESGHPAPPDFVLVPGEPNRGFRLNGGEWAGLVEERFGPPARRVSCGRFDVLVYPDESALRVFARSQTRLLVGLPTSIVAEPAGLVGYVPDLAPRSGHAFRGSLRVRFAPEVRGDYLDVSAPAEARWRIVLVDPTGSDVAAIDLPEMPARGPMRVRLLRLPRAATISELRIEPQSEGDQVLGHVFVDVAPR